MCCDCFSDYVLQSVDNLNLTSGLDATVLFVCLKVRYPIPFLYDFFLSTVSKMTWFIYFLTNKSTPKLTFIL